MSETHPIITLDLTFAYSFILSSCLIGFIFGVWNWYSVMSVKINKKDQDSEKSLLNDENYNLMEEISEKIQNVKIF
jgi:hypothetical protein